MFAYMLWAKVFFALLAFLSAFLAKFSPAFLLYRVFMFNLGLANPSKKTLMLAFTDYNSHILSAIAAFFLFSMQLMNLPYQVIISV